MSNLSMHEPPVTLVSITNFDIEDDESVIQPGETEENIIIERHGQRQQIGPFTEIAWGRGHENMSHLWAEHVYPYYRQTLFWEEIHFSSILIFMLGPSLSRPTGVHVPCADMIDKIFEQQPHVIVKAQYLEIQGNTGRDLLSDREVNLTKDFRPSHNQNSIVPRQNLLQGKENSSQAIYSASFDCLRSIPITSKTNFLEWYEVVYQKRLEKSTVGQPDIQADMAMFITIKQKETQNMGKNRNTAHLSEFTLVVMELSTHDLAVLSRRQSRLSIDSAKTMDQMKKSRFHLIECLKGEGNMRYSKSTWILRDFWNGPKIFFTEINAQEPIEAAGILKVTGSLVESENITHRSLGLSSVQDSGYSPSSFPVMPYKPISRWGSVKKLSSGVSIVKGLHASPKQKQYHPGEQKTHQSRLKHDIQQGKLDDDHNHQHHELYHGPVSEAQGEHNVRKSRFRTSVDKLSKNFAQYHFSDYSCGTTPLVLARSACDTVQCILTAKEAHYFADNSDKFTRSCLKPRHELCNQLLRLTQKVDKLEDEVYQLSRELSKRDRKMEQREKRNLREESPGSSATIEPEARRTEPVFWEEQEQKKGIDHYKQDQNELSSSSMPSSLIKDHDALKIDFHASERHSVSMHSRSMIQTEQKKNSESEFSHEDLNHYDLVVDFDASERHSVQFHQLELSPSSISSSSRHPDEELAVDLGHSERHTVRVSNTSSKSGHGQHPRRVDMVIATDDPRKTATSSKSDHGHPHRADRSVATDDPRKTATSSKIDHSHHKFNQDGIVNQKADMSVGTDDLHAHHQFNQDYLLNQKADNSTVTDDLQKRDASDTSDTSPLNRREYQSSNDLQKRGTSNARERSPSKRKEQQSIIADSTRASSNQEYERGSMLSVPGRNRIDPRIQPDYGILQDEPVEKDPFGNISDHRQSIIEKILASAENEEEDQINSLLRSVGAS